MALENHTNVNSPNSFGIDSPLKDKKETLFSDHPLCIVFQMAHKWNATSRLVIVCGILMRHCQIIEFDLLCHINTQSETKFYQLLKSSIQSEHNIKHIKTITGHNRENANTMDLLQKRQLSMVLSVFIRREAIL